MFEKLRKSFKSFIDSLSGKELNEKDLKEPLEKLFLSLIESDVALPVAEELVAELGKRLTGLRVGRFSNTEELVKKELKESLSEMFKGIKPIDLFAKLEEAKGRGEVFRLVMVGPNGHGKTLTIAKLAKKLLSHNYTVVLACSDTFRAGAEEQLEEHGRRLGVKVIKHRYGADPAAVAFDAISYAKARGLHAVIVDTAGRLQTDKPLMDELRKIVKVVDPHLTILVVDALTGNDALDQAVKFNDAVGLDGSILTKVDADVKGGTAVSIIYAIKKPIFFLGVGQGYEDLMPFSPEWLIQRILPKS